MKTFRIASLCGILFFGVSAVGCGAADTAVASDTGADVTSVTGSDVASGQLGLAEGEDAVKAERAGDRRHDLSRLTELLGLTSDQAAQIATIAQETRDALSALRQQVRDGGLTRAEAHAQAKALRDQQKAQIEALLTAEQLAKFQALRSHHGHPFDLARMTALLGLSAEQVAAIQAVMDETQAKVQEIKAQVEAGTLTPEAARPQIDALMRAGHDAIKAALTAEQLAKLERRPGGRR